MTLDQFKYDLEGSRFGGLDATAFHVTNEPPRLPPLPVMYLAAERIDPGDYVGLNADGRLVRLHIEEGKDIR